METKFFISSPSYGIIEKSNKCKRFNDLKLFKSKSYLFTRLKKVKIWYGSTTVKTITKQPRIILGIECDYRLLTESDSKPQRYSGELYSNDIVVKELELKENSDFFSKLYLCCEDFITYIKFVTKKGKVLEVGTFDKNTNKEISINNEKNPNLIQTLHGFYDKGGLRALGARFIQAKRFFFVTNMDILALRYKAKYDKNFKKHWENEKKYEKLSITMKALIKLVFLPDNPFGMIIKYIIE